MEIGFIRVAARYNAKYHKYKRDTWRYISQIKMGHMKTYITNINGTHENIYHKYHTQKCIFARTLATSSYDFSKDRGALWDENRFKDFWICAVKNIWKRFLDMKRCAMKRFLEKIFEMKIDLKNSGYVPCKDFWICAVKSGCAARNSYLAQYFLPVLHLKSNKGYILNRDHFKCRKSFHRPSKRHVFQMP